MNKEYNMNKNIIKLNKSNLEPTVKNIVKKVLKEAFDMMDGDPNILRILEDLKNKMGAMYVDYNDEQDVYIIESNSSIPMKYIFKSDGNGSVKLLKIDGLEEFKKAFNEVNVLNNFINGGDLSQLK